MGSMLGPNRVIAKVVKSCTSSCYVICTTLVVQVVGIFSLKKGTTHYHAQLEPPDKGCAIISVGCLLCKMAWIYGNGSLDKRKVLSLVP